MKIRLTRGTHTQRVKEDGQIKTKKVGAGETLEVSDERAQKLIAKGRAERVSGAGRPPKAKDGSEGKDAQSAQPASQ